MSLHTQVAIVGGGPVGVALAVELSGRGVSSVVVERRTDLGLIPKGQNLTQRTLEHFWRWGIADQLRQARLMPPGYPIGEMTAYGSLMGEYWHAPPGRELVRTFYHQDNERLPQYQMEKVLRRRMAELPGAVARFGWAATAIEQDEREVRVAIVSNDGAQHQTITADVLVGCDGGQSMVREHAGITRSGTDYDQPMVLAVFRSRELHERLKRFPERSTYRVMRPDLNGFWQFFGRIDVGEGWFFHAPIPAGATRENFDFAGLVHQAAGFSFACEFDYLGFWDLRVAVADQYRKGRIFIAGDAAHTHPPYGGFGLNNGLEDAVNLGWKLAARLNGWGGDALLDSYGAERRPVMQSTADYFIASRIARDAEFFDRYAPEKNRMEWEAAWSARQSDIGARFQQYEPHYDASPVIVGPEGGVSQAQGQHLLKARPGHHLAPQPLSDGRNVFDELGRDFTLLSLGGQPAAVFAQAARAAGLPLKVIEDPGSPARTAYEADFILVRPDQYVAWVGDTLPTDATELIRRVTGRS